MYAYTSPITPLRGTPNFGKPATLKALRRQNCRGSNRFVALRRGAVLGPTPAGPDAFPDPSKDPTNGSPKGICCYDRETMELLGLLFVGSFKGVCSRGLWRNAGIVIGGAHMGKYHEEF